MKRIIVATAALMTGTAAMAAAPAELNNERDMTQHETVIVTEGMQELVPGDEVYLDESRQLLDQEVAEVTVFEDEDDELTPAEIQ